MLTIINAALLFIIVFLLVFILLVAIIFYKRPKVVRLIADFVVSVTAGIAIPVSIAMIQDKSDSPAQIAYGFLILLGFIVTLFITLVLRARNEKEDGESNLAHIKKFEANSIVYKGLNDSYVYVNYKSIWPWKFVKVLCSNNAYKNFKVDVPVKKSKTKETITISYNTDVNNNNR